MKWLCHVFNEIWRGPRDVKLRTRTWVPSLLPGLWQRLYGTSEIWGGRGPREVKLRTRTRVPSLLPGLWQRFCGTSEIWRRRGPREVKLRTPALILAVITARPALWLLEVGADIEQEDGDGEDIVRYKIWQSTNMTSQKQSLWKNLNLFNTSVVEEH